MATRMSIWDTITRSNDDDEPTASPAVPEFGGPVQMPDAPTAEPSVPRDWRQGMPESQPSQQSAEDFWAGIWSGGPEIKGTQTAAGWIYPWRSEPYQNELGAGEIRDEMAEDAFREQYSGYKLPADSAGLKKLMASGGPSGYAPQFDDPGAQFLEKFALDRFNQRTNPDPDSGTALFERYLRELFGSLGQPTAFEGYAPELVNQLKQPVYSDQQSSQLKASVYDNIEVQRDQTKQRWIEEMGRRGIPLSSGPALEGLLRIDEQFGTMRTIADREFATNAIGLTENRRFQILDVLSQLAGAQKARRSEGMNTARSLMESEEGRLDAALPYAAIPKQLGDDAFQQGLALTGAAGNPASSLASALAIYNSVSQNNRLDRARRDASLESIFEYLSGL